MTHPERGTGSGRYPDHQGQYIEQKKIEVTGYHGIYEKVDEAAEDQAFMGRSSTD